MIDYHVHSVLSGDSSAEMRDVCRAAVARGLHEICFTEHADFEPTDLCFGAFDAKRYAAEIRAAREAFDGELVIRMGVEVDFQPKHQPKIRDFLEGNGFDYVVGAAHYANGVILESHESYFPGKTADEAYIPYFENALRAVETGWFDSLAHLDLCKRYGVRYYGPFGWEPYQGLIDSILKALIGKQMTLEINTSGLRQSPEDTYPCEEILARYYGLGGRNITVGSDAHKVEDVGSGVATAMRIARRIGFSSVDTYSNRTRCALAIPDALNARVDEANGAEG